MTFPVPAVVGVREVVVRVAQAVALGVRMLDRQECCLLGIVHFLPARRW